MPHAFDFRFSPFDCLEPDEQRLVREAVDIAYFRPGDALLEPGREATCLYVLVKGHVVETQGEETVASYGPEDCFDGRALVAGVPSSRFVAAEEVIAYELSREAVRTLVARNATFGALLFSDLSNKLGTLARRSGQRQTQALAMAEVGQAFLRPVPVVPGETDIVAVARLLRDRRSSSVLVRMDDADPAGPLGIFTATGLARAVLDGRPLERLPVAELASRPLVQVAPRMPMFEALALMIKHQVHRLVVMDGERVVGLLEQLDALSFVSNHSYLITVQIVQAEDLEALAEAAGRITSLVGLLRRGGTRVAALGTLVQELNAKLFERAWQLVAPQALVAASCLFVMGSEGRGEQLLRTDQDNALVVDDALALDDAEIAAACERLAAALERFGYPPCPGGMMARHPAWRRRAADFAATVTRWLERPEGEDLVHLAVFLDAHAVAGDAALLDRLRDRVFGHVAADDAVLARFAAPIEAFELVPGGGWLNRLLAIGEQAPPLDLKKAGIFPIVHGVRSLALQAGVRATSTSARLKALVEVHRLPAALATDVLDSLHFLMGLRLEAGLAEIDRGLPPSGSVDASRLSSLERDLLKDALGVVKRLRTLLVHHFHLDA